MLKSVRIAAGVFLLVFGAVFFILPGTVLFLALGLFLLSYDIPAARRWLTVCQNTMSKSARRLDRFLLARKMR